MFCVFCRLVMANLIYELLPFIEDCIVIMLIPLNSILHQDKRKLSSQVVWSTQPSVLKNYREEELGWCNWHARQLCEAKFQYILSTSENIFTAEFNYVFQQSDYAERCVYVVTDECLQERFRHCSVLLSTFHVYATRIKKLKTLQQVLLKNSTAGYYCKTCVC